jgi:hypothetical protein
MTDARETVNKSANPSPAPGQLPDWLQSLPEDWTAPGRDETGAEVQIPLRRHPALAKYASKDEAIKALAHAQRLLGKKGEGAPSLLASDAAGGGQPGLPERPEDYRLPDVELPEDFRIDENLRNAFLAKAYELGLTEAQVGGLYAWFVPLNVHGVQEQKVRAGRERKAVYERELCALRQAHGGSAKGVLEAARKAALALGGQDLIDRLNTTGAGCDARVIQALARIAPMVSEAAMRGRDAGPAQVLTPQRLREMMRDPRYYDPSRRDPDYVRQVQQGFESLYPGEKTMDQRLPG